MRYQLRVALTSLVSLATVCSCGTSDLKNDRPNFILISIDTLRPDHLTCYGYARKTSPNIDQLAKQSILFTNAFAPTPWTLPSHVAMLTGTHPFILGIESRDSVIPAETVLVSQLLRKNGYQSAAFVDSPPDGLVGVERGFGRGFVTFNHAPYAEDYTFRYDARLTFERAIGWLRYRTPGQPYFLFLHTKSVHSVEEARGVDSNGAPYDKPEPYRSRFLKDEQLALDWHPPFSGYLLEQNVQRTSGGPLQTQFPPSRLDALVGQYDSGISYTDEQLGHFLQFLRDERVLDGTYVILTADHGEAFLEHGLFLHQQVYSQLLRVPLMLRPPRGAGETVIDAAVSIEDITPTILTLAGISPPSSMTGRTLPLTKTQGQDERDLFSYYLYGTSGAQDQYALQLGKWKQLLRRGKSGWISEFYNIRNDPAELNPRQVGKEVKRVLEERLRQWILKSPVGNTRSLQPKKSTIELLRSLGYVQ